MFKRLRPIMNGKHRETSEVIMMNIFRETKIETHPHHDLPAAFDHPNRTSTLDLNGSRD